MFKFWYRWLLVVYAYFVVMGVSFAMFSDAPIFAMLTGPLNEPFWGSGAMSPEAARFQHFAYGVVGALTAAMGVVFLYITHNAIARRESWAWYALLASLLVWLVIDNAMSAYTGVTINVFFNTGFAVLVVIPLIGIRRYLSPVARPAPAGV